MPEIAGSIPAVRTKGVGKCRRKFPLSENEAETFLDLVERLEESGYLTQAEELAATLLGDAVMSALPYVPGERTPDYVLQLKKRPFLRFKVWYDINVH